MASAARRWNKTASTSIWKRKEMKDMLSFVTPNRNNQSNKSYDWKLELLLSLVYGKLKVKTSVRIKKTLFSLSFPSNKYFKLTKYFQTVTSPLEFGGTRQQKALRVLQVQDSVDTTQVELSSGEFVLLHLKHKYPELAGYKRVYKMRVTRFLLFMFAAALLVIVQKSSAFEMVVEYQDPEDAIEFQDFDEPSYPDNAVDNKKLDFTIDKDEPHEDGYDFENLNAVNEDDSDNDDHMSKHSLGKLKIRRIVHGDQEEVGVEEEGQDHPGVLQEEGHPGVLQEDDLPGVLQEDDLPGVLQEDDLPGVLQEDDLPGVLQEDDLPGVLHEDDRPGVLQEDDLPGVLHEDDRPGVLQEDDLPGVLQGDGRPGVLQEDGHPGVLQEDDLLFVLQGDVRPGVLQEDDLPCVLQEDGLPCVLQEDGLPGVPKGDDHLCILQEEETRRTQAQRKRVVKKIGGWLSRTWRKITKTLGKGKFRIRIALGGGGGGQTGGGGGGGGQTGGGGSGGGGSTQPVCDRQCKMQIRKLLNFVKILEQSYCAFYGSKHNQTDFLKYRDADNASKVFDSYIAESLALRTKEVENIKTIDSKMQFKTAAQLNADCVNAISATLPCKSPKAGIVKAFQALRCAAACKGADYNACQKSDGYLTTALENAIKAYTAQIEAKAKQAK
eukprot:gene10954-12115_t